eukprot:CAMPEP_0119007374 /NCGR_PEP_ID=MMETSP1176-20130426/2971_1 /TAXON_ID=265551 /ORGANISM="Synedropsis recta cf, Strain CCMP1620" /LENGTH=110 /DNA_ID=CAMNT_0006959505 /DNA_START=12 /DNA_END=344 /DNA_ORIENTATION=-
MTSVDLKPGQKFPTPTPGFGDRVFYETLYRQKPNSAMAQEWCVHYGVLPEDEAGRINKKVMDRKKNRGVVLSPARKATKKRSKVKVEAAVSVESDFKVGGSEHVGSSTML